MIDRNFAETAEPKTTEELTPPVEIPAETAAKPITETEVKMPSVVVEPTAEQEPAETPAA